MVVFDLLLTVCLATDANYCRTEHIYLENDGTQMQCMVHAQTHIARWIDSHPDFRVKHWECVNPDIVRKV